ncbi:hypothetical protein AM1_0558 [Acaryochloris marina MBIC11017]|uniref:Uncharacterized protein n=1 Tax=Acaryochloris marina (strain MBIC 11017) TaxID=329726 RepID=B0CD17_ACAM1|nr:hypothetical protein AM1_0558 [Acaryochloris marina MBIC11017]
MSIQASTVNTESACSFYFKHMHISKLGVLRGITQINALLAMP